MMEAGSPGFAGPGVRGAPALQVRPGLLLGPAVAAEPGGLREAGVSAVLTVDSEEPAWAPGAAALGLRTLYVAALDSSEADLLGQLDRCVAFLLQARAEGRTALVHCHAGVSRSVAVVTAFLMKTEQLSFEAAYRTIQALKPEAKMNEGFEAQLKLYEAMGCEVDSASALYKQYCLQKATGEYPELQHLPPELFASDPSTLTPGPQDQILYRCRKCRRPLFRRSSVLDHNEGCGSLAFAHKRGTTPLLVGSGVPAQCTSYFVEPIQWMQPALLGVLDGQLLCPKCKAKLGSFNWYGEQCSCGRWITPAFQVHKNRVDEMRPLLVPGLLTGAPC
ncbi:dual specificity protein phosphatase 12 [Suncus etruscus]|uniref:dual specificity protein phosphatase 12 n=1 Tax=Suncus etruscus TaxID=109475 RepID=UPI00210F6F89|nr:dual specificity protein phosphatase 12 [Suncus etruscus]